MIAILMRILVKLLKIYKKCLKITKTYVDRHILFKNINKTYSNNQILKNTFIKIKIASKENNKKSFNVHRLRIIFMKLIKKYHIQIILMIKINAIMRIFKIENHLLFLDV